MDFDLINDLHLFVLKILWLIIDKNIYSLNLLIQTDFHFKLYIMN